MKVAVIVDSGSLFNRCLEGTVDRMQKLLVLLRRRERERKTGGSRRRKNG